MSWKKRGSEALMKLQWPAIFDVGLCVGKKRGSEALRKLQWTTIFDVGLCGKKRGSEALTKLQWTKRGSETLRKLTYIMVRLCRMSSELKVIYFVCC